MMDSDNVNTETPQTIYVLAVDPSKSPNESREQHSPENNTDKCTLASKDVKLKADRNHYDNETVLLLLEMMKKAGYGDRRLQKKSLKDVFAEAVKLARTEHKVIRSTKAWQKKFTGMKQEYTAYIAKISDSGRDGDDERLYNKPDFFVEMHELEKEKARHNPPAVLCTDEASVFSDAPLSSSRKRVKLSSRDKLSDYIEKQEQRHQDLITEIRKSNDKKTKIRNVLERFVDKF